MEEQQKEKASLDVEAVRDSVNVTFRSLGLCEELLLACEKVNWLVPTAIQKEVIPIAIKDKRDIIAIAETGSGKTGAFALPIIHALLDKPQKMFALVLTPTRELCVQIAECFNALGSSICLDVISIVGGLDKTVQILQIAKKPHVIVGTPGRVADHLEHTKGMSLGSIKFLVLDEADRLLSMDFEVAIDKILEVLPKNRQTFLFSATMTTKVSKLQRASLRNPVKVEVSSRYETVSSLSQFFLLIPMKYKPAHLLYILSKYSKYSVMVFTNTCVSARRMAICLRHMSLSAICLTGKMTQPQRLGALNQFKSANNRILFATEVGSRGLDIPSVNLVLNYDVPLSSKDYIHRVGRTARAGKSGVAITFVTQYDVELFQRIEKALNKKLPEFKDVIEAEVLGYHEKTLEALRVAEREVKEAEEEKLISKGKNNSSLRRTKSSKSKKRIRTN